MNVRCKPGDLAYLSSDCVSEGVIVEVLRAIPLMNGNPSWACVSKTPIHCVGELSRKDRFCTEISIEDRYLRPINGLPMFEETTEDCGVTA